jgi:signal transduction histidine kinase
MKKNFSGTLVLISMFSTIYFHSEAQSKKVDSLNACLANAKHDTTRVAVLLQLASHFYLSNTDTAMGFCNEVLNISKRINYKEGLSEAYGWIGYLNYMQGNYKIALEYYDLDLKTEKDLSNKKGIATVYNNIGLAYNAQGDFEKALDYFNKSLALRKEIKDTVGISGAYNNLGLAYYSKGDIPKALEFFEASYKLKLETKDKAGAATSLNNLGAICYQQGNIGQSLEYYHKSLKMREEVNDQQGMGYSFNNIGSILEKQGDAAKGLEYYQKSLKSFEAVKDKNGIADAYGNIGALYGNNGDPLCNPKGSPECILQSQNKALEFFKKSLALNEEINDPSGIANDLLNIGEIYKKQSKFGEAQPLFEKALKLAREAGLKQLETIALHNLATLKFTQNDISGSAVLSLNSLKLAQELGFPSLLRDISQLLYKVYKKQNKQNEALEMHELYVLMKDSINNKETRKAADRKRFQYEYEKKEALLRLEQQRANELHLEELKRQDVIKWSSIGLLSLTLVSSTLFLNRYRLKQKNKLQEQLNAQQKEQASAVMEVQEQERKRIAEDLHDSLGHLLSTAKLNLQTNPVAQPQVDNSLILLNQASEEIRNITFNLMPRTLEEEGLIPALTELVNKVTKSGTVKVLLHVHDMDKFILEKQSQFNIYRIVQEAVNNILKHADANEINIQLIGQNDHMTIMIEDDGKGFVPGENKQGRGLKNIVTRSLWLKGNINIDSTPGRGTTITTEIPV